MLFQFCSILPSPSNVTDDWVHKDPWFKQHEKVLAVTSVVKEPPPYGFRKGYKPRSDEVGTTNS